jgi:NodT family efflux transporter outer membrane factor (OMF) lipoprotein
MKKNFAISYIILSICIIGFACKPPAKTVLPNSIPIPTNYQGNYDSTNFGTISYKEFFGNEDLVQLIDTALKNNFDIQIAVQQISMANNNWLISKGLTKPVVNGVVSSSVEKFGDYTMNGLGNYDMNLSPNINKNQQIPVVMPDMFLGFRSNWEIDIWNKLSNTKKAAFARYNASLKEKQWLTTQIVAQISFLYFELLALDREVLILEKNIELQERALEIVIAQKQGGRATELAVQQFQAQILNTKGILYSIKQSIVETENAIKILTGKHQLKINRKKDIYEYVLPSIIKAGIPSQLLHQRPDIQSAEWKLEASGADVEASRKAFLPSLNITAFIALNSFNPAFLFSPESLAFGLLGGLTSPLVNKSLLKGNYEKKKAAQLEAFYTYQKTILVAVQEIQTLLKGIDNYQKIYGYKLEESKTLELAVSTSKDLYISGFASYLEVITAQRGALDAELESIKNKKMIFTQLIGLYRSLGGGWQ